MPNGARMDLLNCEGGHHKFVMGESDTFPEISMNYLVGIGLTTAEEYRMLAIGERLRHLALDNGSRPCDESFLSGATYELIPDKYISAGIWDQRVVPSLRRLRRQRLRGRFILAHGGDRTKVVRELDVCPDAAEVFEKSAFDRLNAIEQAFTIGADGPIVVGDGAASRWYVRTLLEMRLDKLIGRLRNPQGDITDHLEYAAFERLFGEPVAAYANGMREWRKLVHMGAQKRAKRGCYTQKVRLQAIKLGEILIANRPAALEAMATCGLVIFQPSVVANANLSVLAEAA